MLQSLLDLLYPVRCPICGEIVVPKGNRICSLCTGKLKSVEEPRCMKCSKPIEHEEMEYCKDCIRKDYHYVKGYALWVYDDSMKKSIADFKYHYKKENSHFYVQELLRIYQKTIKSLAPDAFVPVPVHRSKYRERGYNQADVLAKGIARETGIPVISDLLLRNKKTLPQKQLDDKERLRNLQEAFSYNKKVEPHHNLKKIMLIDDIYTTGSTIEACTNVLMNHGIMEVYFMTLCIGKGY